MKKTYEKPATELVAVEIEELLNVVSPGVFPGTSVKGSDVLSRELTDFDDDVDL